MGGTRLSNVVREFRRATTGGLVSTICWIVVLAALPGYLTFGYFQDMQILAERGVQAVASVTEVNGSRRAPDTVVVRSVDPPYFESTLYRSPDVRVGDRIDVVFDPQRPARIAAVDAPLINGSVLVVAGLDLLSLLALLFAAAAATELVRRAWVRLGDDRRPDSDGLRR